VFETLRSTVPLVLSVLADGESYGYALIQRVRELVFKGTPEAQQEAGVKLFLIARGKDNPAQFLFYELFRDEGAFKAHQESPHFKTYIAEQALPLLAKRERAAFPV